MVEKLWFGRVSDSDAVYWVNVSEWLVMRLINFDLTEDGGRSDIALGVGLKEEERLVRCVDNGGSLGEPLFCVAME